MNVEARTGEIPKLMMSLMRQFSVARTRLSAARRDGAPPGYLLAKIGQGTPRRAGELDRE